MCCSHWWKRNTSLNQLRHFNDQNTKLTFSFDFNFGTVWNPCSFQAPRYRNRKIKYSQLQFQTQTVARIWLLTWGSVWPGQASRVWQMIATHSSLLSASPSCEAREVWSGSDPHSSSTEPLGVGLSSWLTTSWLRLSGSDSHVTKWPKPAGKKQEIHVTYWGSNVLIHTRR